MIDYEQGSTDFPLVWVKCEGGQLPKGLNPVFGGLSVKDGEPTYVARAKHQDHTIPGRFVPFKGKCYVGHDLTEHSYTNYQVLTKPPGTNLEWVLDQDGHIPVGAVVGGRESDGTKLYIGRVYFDGFGICGKVHRQHKVLYITQDGYEHRIKKYQVLVISDVSFQWIDCENGQVPHSQLNPVLCGITADGEPTYVARAKFEMRQSHGVFNRQRNVYEQKRSIGSHLFPSSLVPSQKKCYLEFDRVISFSRYQVLTNPFGTKLEWMPASDGRVPEGALIGGYSQGRKLFIGRVYHDGFGICGCIIAENKLLYLVSGETEWQCKQFEVLVDTDKLATTATNRGVTM